MAKISISLSAKIASKARTKKSPRSLFLSALMKAFGGHFGGPAADAFAKQDAAALKKVFAEAADSLSASFNLSKSSK